MAIRKLLLVLTLIISIIALGGHVARAQDGEDASEAVLEEVDVEDTEVPIEEVIDEEDNEDKLGASQDGVTTHIFADYSPEGFPAGSVSSVVVGFKNVGSTKAFHLQNVEASLRHLQDFSYYLYNFSALAIDVIVQPGEEVSVLYQFRPHETFEPRAFGFVLNVNYVDQEGKQYVDAVVNTTVSIVDPLADSTSAFAYVAGASLVAVLAFLAHQQLTTSNAGKQRKILVETGTKSPAAAAAAGGNEWLANMNLPGSAPKRKSRTPSKAD